MSSKQRKLMIAVLIITISSQINIDILIADFRVTGAVIAFGIILYFYRDIHPIKLSLMVSLSTYCWRIGIVILSRGFNPEAIAGFAPEMLFYILYGVVFWYLSHRNTIYEAHKYFLITLLSDLAANFMEILVHYVLFGEELSVNVLVILLVVAIIRSSIVWLSIKGSKYYQMFVLIEEREARYNKLVWLSLNLKSEVYWMAKNMDKIEETMSHAYRLFEDIQNNNNPEKWADHSVEVASDVHEIKKDYELIMRGVTEITEFRFQDKGMHFSDLMKLVEYKINMEIIQKEFNLEVKYGLGENFYTNKHYQLMSIFRNLFINALDAIEHRKEHNKITFTHTVENGQHMFEIEDTGGGIEAEDIEAIFNPGFSTKINYETGEINRGVGLSLVKDLIEKTLNGSIVVDSTPKIGTTFMIKIPKIDLEVQE